MMDAPAMCHTRGNQIKMGALARREMAEINKITRESIIRLLYHVAGGHVHATFE